MLNWTLKTHSKGFETPEGQDLLKMDVVADQAYLVESSTVNASLCTAFS